MGTYLEFEASGLTAIAVQFENYEEASEVEPHQHLCHEFVIINKGSCIHNFRGVDVPLIAGDIFILPPGEPHSYQINPNTSITNCYFFPDQIEQIAEYLQRESSPEQEDLGEVRHQWDHLLNTITFLQEDIPDAKTPIIDNFSRQGVLRLTPEEALDVESLLQRIHEEDIHPLYQSEHMKTAVLQMILVIFQRAKNHIPQRLSSLPDARKQMILNSLTFMEEKYPESLTVKMIADASSLSESYFRVVFKEVTGLTPLNYLNRLRIVKALEYIQGDGLSITEAAAKVGIYDANYFTRLFKKIMGHSPHYFKKIANKSD